MHASNTNKSKQNTVLYPTNMPQDALKPDITLLRRETCKGRQDNHFNMKRLRNKTDTSKGQEAPRFSLDLQTEVAQHLSQQCQAKEGGGVGETKQY